MRNYCSLYSTGNREMKYLMQFCIVMLFVLVGELLGNIIPLPIAGSIYGLVLLFLALCFKIVRLSWVEDFAGFIHGIMALFFVAPAVAVIEIWGDIANVWWILVLVLVTAYMVTMLTTGVTAQALIKDKNNKSKKTKAAK